MTSLVNHAPTPLIQALNQDVPPMVPLTRVDRIDCPMVLSCSHVGRLAQMGERLVYTQEVAGSSPVPPTIKRFIIEN